MLPLPAGHDCLSPQEKLIEATCPLSLSLTLFLLQSKFEGNPGSRLGPVSSGKASILKEKAAGRGDSSASVILLLTNCSLGDRLLFLPPPHIWGVCKDVQGSPLYWRWFSSTLTPPKEGDNLVEKMAQGPFSECACERPPESAEMPPPPPRLWPRPCTPCWWDFGSLIPFASRL